MIVCDRCRRYATSCCRNCLYFGDIYGSITGDSYGEHVSDEEAYRVLNEMYPEDFHGKFATKIILAYRFVSRVLLPFLLYEKWNRPRQYVKGKYYPPFNPPKELIPSGDEELPF